MKHGRRRLTILGAVMGTATGFAPSPWSLPALRGPSLAPPRPTITAWAAVGEEKGGEGTSSLDDMGALDRMREDVEVARKSLEALRVAAAVKESPSLARETEGGFSEEEIAVRRRRRDSYLESVLAGDGTGGRGVGWNSPTLEQFLVMTVKNYGWREDRAVKAVKLFEQGLAFAGYRSEYEDGATVLGDGGKASFFAVEERLKQRLSARGEGEELSRRSSSTSAAKETSLPAEEGSSGGMMGSEEELTFIMRSAEAVGLYVGGGLRVGDETPFFNLDPAEWYQEYKGVGGDYEGVEWSITATTEEGERYGEVVAAILIAAVAWGAEEARVMLNCLLELSSRERRDRENMMTSSYGEGNSDWESERNRSSITPTSSPSSRNSSSTFPTSPGTVGLQPQQQQDAEAVEAIALSMRIASSQAHAALRILSQQSSSYFEGKSGQIIAEEALEASRLWPCLHTDVLPSLGIDPVRAMEEGDFTPLTESDLRRFREEALTPDLWQPGVDPRKGEGLDPVGRIQPTGLSGGDVLPINGVGLFRGGRFMGTSPEAVTEEVRRRLEVAGLAGRMKVILWRETSPRDVLLGAGALQAELEDGALMDELAMSIAGDDGGVNVNPDVVLEMLFPSNNYAIVVIPSDASPSLPNELGLLMNGFAWLTALMFLSGGSGGDGGGGSSIAQEDAGLILGLVMLVQLAHELAHAVAAGLHRVGLQFPIFLPSVPLGIAGGIQRLKGWPKDAEGMFDIAASGIGVGSVLSILMFVTGLVLTTRGEGPLVQVPDGLVGSSLLCGTLVDLLLPGFRGVGSFVPMHPLAAAGYIAMRVQAMQCLPLMGSDARTSLLAIDAHSSFKRADFAGAAALLLIMWAGAVGDLGPLAWVACMAGAGYSRVTSWPMTAPPKAKALGDGRLGVALLLQFFMLLVLSPMPGIPHVEDLAATVGGGGSGTTTALPIGGFFDLLK